MAIVASLSTLRAQWKLTLIGNSNPKSRTFGRHQSETSIDAKWITKPLMRFECQERWKLKAQVSLLAP